MDNDSIESFPSGHRLTVLAVSNDAPLAPLKFAQLGKAQVLRAGTKIAAASLIGSQRIDLVVIQENDNWNDVKGVVNLAAAGTVGAIIVQGPRLGGFDHLRAILAGADIYAPLGEDAWRFDLKKLSSEKPVDKLTRELTDALRPYGSGVAANMLWEMTKNSSSRLTPVGVSGLIRRAARRVNDNLSDKIITATIPRVRRLLDETGMDVIGGTQAEPVESPDVHTNPYLYWNVRFPESPSVLSNEPHEVSVDSTYILETAIEPIGGPDGTTETFPADQLTDKKISFILRAINGQFRVGPKEEWHSVVMSEMTTCSKEGTPPFQGEYHALEPGYAEIELTLLVNGGSIAQQVIELSVIGDDLSQGDATSQGIGKPLSVPALTDAPGSELLLLLEDRVAMLSERETETISRAQWDGKQPERGTVVASVEAYAQLGALSERFIPSSGMQLIGVDGDEALLNLAIIGSKLYRALFKDWGPDIPPPELEEIRERMLKLGDIKSPPILQIIAPNIPVPWGILYDGDPPGLETNPMSIQTDRFWGMRFDIYRYASSVTGVRRLRGKRCVVKPIVGKTVPRSAQQLDFIAQLSKPAATTSKVRKPAQTTDDLLTWAAHDDANDLLYFYCHAVPKERALVFGSTDQAQDRVSLDQLTVKLGQARRRNPVVILNACSSAQIGAANGKPFVDFFMKKWGAQAFIGTDWPVQAILADAIGQRLLAEIVTERRSLRMALRAVISAGATEGNYFPLMYAIYGPSNVQFTET